VSSGLGSVDLVATFVTMASELFTDRLHLRPWRASDAVAHRDLCVDPSAREGRFPRQWPHFARPAAREHDLDDLGPDRRHPL